MSDRPRVCVFAPTPLLTVTIEQPSSDRGDGEVHLHPGGQGFWIARMLLRLDIDVVVCAALGGETGPILRRLMADAGMTVVAVDAGSNGAYVHDRRSGSRVEVAAMPAVRLSRHDVDDLYGATLVEALAASVTVLSGPEDGADVLPDDFYRRLTVDIRANGGRVVADLSGARLQAVVQGGVDVLKVSEEELERDGLLATAGSVGAAMQQLVAGGAGSVIVSHGDERASALIDGELVQAIAPALEPVETRGAGDSLTAAVVAGLARGGSLADALRLGSAAGALNVTRRGLGSGGRDQIERLAERVRIEPGEASCER
jgi:1-phosphofructokinase